MPYFLHDAYEFASVELIGGHLCGIGLEFLRPQAAGRAARAFHCARQPALSARSGHLSYTTMTLSCAVKELEYVGLASVVDIGRERRLRFDDDAQAIWRRALPMLRDPVKKSVWVMPDPTVHKQAYLAGGSTLASATLLAEPVHPVYAISMAQ